MQINNITLVILMCLTISSSGQNTVGTVVNKLDSEDYILFAPMSHHITYLIDREGRQINSWVSDYVPGLTAYLDEEGNLFRAGRSTEKVRINQGGAGGVMEKFDWEGNLLWQYHIANDTIRQHHDFELLPNGNLLLIAWEYKSKEEALSAGRKAENLNANALWPDVILEIRPIGDADAEIVWEWHVWDHLIQDVDSNTTNYGNIGKHPGKIDINFFELPITDWIHGNSLDYNEEIDQIIFSSRSFNEIWIIDHDINSQEAKQEPGDLLYRWGNPETYQKGNIAEQMLFGQHGVEWIKDNNETTPGFIVFNNGHRRPQHPYATIDYVEIPLNPSGNYMSDSNQVFLPHRSNSTFINQDSMEMYAPLFSNVQLLPNQHYLICVGPRGTFLEYDYNGTLLWKYISPVTENGSVLMQGDTIGDIYSSINSVFAIQQYDQTFPGFRDKSLNPGEVIEQSITVSTILPDESKILIYPNPTSEKLFIQGVPPRQPIEIYTSSGKKIQFRQNESTIDVQPFPAGIYLMKIENQVFKFLKN